MSTEVMSIERQVEIMETQLSNFTGLMEKLTYLHNFFDADPQFSQRARDIVRSNLCREYS